MRLCNHAYRTEGCEHCGSTDITYEDRQMSITEIFMARDCFMLLIQLGLPYEEELKKINEVIHKLGNK